MQRHVASSDFFIDISANSSKLKDISKSMKQEIILNIQHDGFK